MGCSHAADVQVVLPILQGLPIEGPHILWLRARPGHAPQGEGCVEVHFNSAARTGGGILEDSHSLGANCRVGGRDRGGTGMGWEGTQECTPGFLPTDWVPGAGGAEYRGEDLSLSQSHFDF